MENSPRPAHATLSLGGVSLILSPQRPNSRVQSVLRHYRSNEYEVTRRATELADSGVPGAYVFALDDKGLRSEA
jgi:hypothetical protein